MIACSTGNSRRLKALFCSTLLNEACLQFVPFFQPNVNHRKESLEMNDLESRQLGIISVLGKAFKSNGILAEV